MVMTKPFLMRMVLGSVDDPEVLSNSTCEADGLFGFEQPDEDAAMVPARAVMEQPKNFRRLQLVSAVCI